MSTTYTIEIEENQADVMALETNEYDLALARFVSTTGPAGAPVSNTVFMSRPAAAHITLKWTEDYGINFTDTESSGGATITTMGKWQPINLGDSYTLDATGVW